MRILISTSTFYLYYIHYVFCLWSNGVVHYVINRHAYDEHSQEIIRSVLNKLQNEICVKFFNIPLSYGIQPNVKVLYIHNPDNRKDCPKQWFNMESNTVYMVIGYKCLNEQDITRIFIDMLRASIKEKDQANIIERDIKNKVALYNNFTTLIGVDDRNYINTFYYNECKKLDERKPILRIMSDNYTEMSENNMLFYKDKLWPLGIVFYGVENSLHTSKLLRVLKKAMSTIESCSCIIFQPLNLEETLIPKNFLWFMSTGGETIPRLGFTEGNQTISINAMVEGAPGHTAHTLNLLMRILGVPMMSNRFDRNHYITVNWKNVQKGMEYCFEVMPVDAFVRISGKYVPYDFTSVTHAPVNYLCEDCALGQQTVSPVTDHLWQKTLTMGHRTDLNPTDKEVLNFLYSKQCQNRIFKK